MIKLFENRKLFWDTDISKLDLNNNADYIVTRIFERGDVEDIRNCRRHYGDEVISKILQDARFLSEQTLYLAAAIFKKDITDFRCYALKQSNPELFLY